MDERPPATAATMLRVHVSNLRKTLGSEVLLTREGGYVPRPSSRARLYADRFQELVDEVGQRSARVTPARRASCWTVRWGCGAGSRWLIWRTSSSRRARSRGFGGAAERGRGPDRRGPTPRSVPRAARRARGARRAAPAPRTAVGATDGRAIPIRAPCRRSSGLPEAPPPAGTPSSAWSQDPELRALQQQILNHDPALEARARRGARGWGD